MEVAIQKEVDPKFQTNLKSLVLQSCPTVLSYNIGLQETMESYSKQFTFTPIPKEKFNPLETKENSKLLEKWGLKERINLQVWRKWKKESIKFTVLKEGIERGNWKNQFTDLKQGDWKKELKVKFNLREAGD